MENKEEQYVYLWVLDFNDGQVYKYNIEKRMYNEEPEHCEDYMQRLGHEISNVQWMISPYDEVLDENNGWNVADPTRSPIDNMNVTNKI